MSSITAIGATLNGSAFSDPDPGNTHAASQWQVDVSAGNYSSPIFDSGQITSSLTTRAVVGLNASTAYKGRVRYRDNGGEWSLWSASQSFTTAASATGNSPPATPTVTVSNITALGATLTGSSFSDPNPGNTHASSQWQVDLTLGNYTLPIFDSGETTSSLTTRAVVGLLALTGYKGRVRYRDNAGAWSPWSSDRTFTTLIGGGGGGGGTAGYIFTSDWSTATGSSSSALSDGGRWGQVGGESTVRIIPSTGLDFPTANVLDVHLNGSREGYWHSLKTGMPAPAVGESRYYRWYIRVTLPDNGVSDPGTHPIQDNYAQNWDFEIINRSGTFVPRWDNGASRWTGPALQKNRTYRFEFHMYRNGSSSYQLHARVFDSSGAQVAGDADFRLEYPAGQTLASLPSLALSNASALSGITAGNNGLAGSAPYPFTYSYQAAFCIRSDTWCGPYTTSERR